MTQCETIQALNETMSRNNSLVCCGLDPDLRLMPREIVCNEHLSPEEKIITFLKAVIDATAPFVCAYKIQRAFFDLFLPSRTPLAAITTYVHTTYPRIPVFLDSKVGDVGHTMDAYLSAAFSHIGVDGIVLNPYMGDDVLLPLAAFPDKAGIVLVKTSNKGGDVVQDLQLANGIPLWSYILETLVTRWNTAGNLIPIISSVHFLSYKQIRKQIPDQMPILLAGYGAQGGSLNNLCDLLNSQQKGVFINSSRALIYAYNPENVEWRERIATATIAMRDAINTHRCR